MLFGSVALVLRKPVHRVEPILLAHVAVTFHLCDDRSRRDRIAQRVAVDQRMLPRRDLQSRQRVDQHVRDRRFHLLKRLVERALRRLQNIDLVDHGLIHPRGLRLDAGAQDPVVQRLPPRLGNLFRVVDVFQKRLRRHHDAADDDRTGKRSAPDFVHARKNYTVLCPERAIAFGQRQKPLRLIPLRHRLPPSAAVPELPLRSCPRGTRPARSAPRARYRIRRLSE